MKDATPILIIDHFRKMNIVFTESLLVPMQHMHKIYETLKVHMIKDLNVLLLKTVDDSIYCIGFDDFNRYFSNLVVLVDFMVDMNSVLFDINWIVL